MAAQLIAAGDARDIRAFADKLFAMQHEISSKQNLLGTT